MIQETWTYMDVMQANALLDMNEDFEMAINEMDSEEIKKE